MQGFDVPPIDVGAEHDDALVIRSPRSANGANAQPQRDPIAAAVFQARRAPPTGKSLFLSGLRPDVDFTDLAQAFEAFGSIISCRVLRDAKSGESRCIGYVNFTTDEAAQKAIQAMDGAPGPKGGGPLRIKLADNDPSFVPEASNKIFVRFIPTTVSVDDVKRVFGQYGTIIEAVVSRDTSRAAKKEAEPWHMAYISFATPEQAVEAVAATDRRPSPLGPHHLVVKPAENPTTRQVRQEWRAAAVASLRAVEGTSSGPSTAHNSAAPTPKNDVSVVHTGLPKFPAVGHQVPFYAPAHSPLNSNSFGHGSTLPHSFGQVGLHTRTEATSVSPSNSTSRMGSHQFINNNFAAPMYPATPTPPTSMDFSPSGRFFVQQANGSLIEVAPPPATAFTPTPGLQVPLQHVNCDPMQYAGGHCQSQIPPTPIPFTAGMPYRVYTLEDMMS
jgi:RNA recognition motif-containing protein